MRAQIALATREALVGQVAGVQTLWAPGEGMLAARLQFRVGQADERLPFRGITHLIEHLAFERLGHPTYSHNGSVTMETTSFDVAGTQDEIAEFLRVVTTGLHHPPIERIDAERHLLKVESRRRGGVMAELASVRHGAQGHGLSAYLELGLEHLQAEQLRSWARTWFTADNAVLWLWGGDPDGFELALPSGQRCRPPAVQSQPLAPRSWLAWGDSGVALTFLAQTDRGTANAVSWWLQRYLTKALRHGAGLAYSVDVDQRQLGDRRIFSVAVDGLPDRNVALRDALLGALEGLGTVMVSQEDLAAWKRETNEVLSSTDRAAELGRLDMAAKGLLLTGVPTHHEEVMRQCASVTVDGMALALRRWHETCLLAVPRDVDMPEGWTPRRRTSDAIVQGGQVYVPAAAALAGHRLLVGAEGVTAEASRTTRWTVSWAECAAVLRHADGSLTPIGKDGVSIQLLPQDWVDEKTLFRQLASYIRPELLVPVESKPTEEMLTGLSGLAALSTGLLVALVVTCWLATIMILAVLNDPASGGGILQFFVLLTLLSLGATWALVTRLRAPKERRTLPKEPSVAARRTRSWLAQQSTETLMGLEIGAWILTAIVAVVAVRRGGSPLLAILVAGAARQVRRERQRVLGRRGGLTAASG